MKKYLATAVLTLTLAVHVHAQNFAPTAGGYAAQPVVLTTAQAQAQTTAAMQRAITQNIGIMENSFNNLSNVVTANALHLTEAQVIAGFGTTFNTQVLAEGQLLLSTIIKSNLILGRSDAWLTQPWVQVWITTYNIDPGTGNVLATPAPTPTP